MIAGHRYYLFNSVNTSYSKKALLGMKQKVWRPRMLFILKNEKHSRGKSAESMNSYRKSIAR